MSHTKTFEAINKLKDIELELHRLKNALEMANKALDAQRKPLTDEEYSALAETYTGADGLDCVDFGRAVARHYGIKE